MRLQSVLNENPKIDSLRDAAEHATISLGVGAELICMLTHNELLRIALMTKNRVGNSSALLELKATAADGSEVNVAQYTKKSICQDHGLSLRSWEPFGW
eukprot:1262550-Amphidinium_carterae.1